MTLSPTPLFSASKTPLTQALWTTVKTSSSISEAVCKILLKKEAFGPLFYNMTVQNLSSSCKYSLISQFIESGHQLGWDFVNKSGVSFGLFGKIYYIGYNIFHFLFCGQIRYDNRKEFILLKILESITFEDSYKDKQFLELSFYLKLKLIQQLKIYPDQNYQILARQVILKIDAVHRLYTSLDKKEQVAIFPGLPPFLAFDQHYVSEEVSKQGLILEFAPKFQNNPEIVTKAYIQAPESLQFAHKDLKRNKAFILELLKISDVAYDFLDADLKNDEDIILSTVLKNGKRLKTMSSSAKQNKTFVLASLTSPIFDFSLVNLFAQDKEVMLLAYSKNSPLKIADLSLMDDKDFIIRAIGLRGWDVYVRASRRLQNDLEVKLAAYKKRYMKKKLFDDELIHLERIFPQLFNDHDFVSYMVKCNGRHFKFASARLKKCPEIILAALKDHNQLFHELKQELISDKDFMIKACRIRGAFIQHTTEALQKDLDVASAALENSYANFVYLDITLRTDSSFIKNYVLKYPEGIGLVDHRYLDLDDAMEVLKRHGHLYNWMGEHVKDSIPHIKAAFFSFPRMIDSVDYGIINDSIELSRLYILYKLDRASTTLRGVSYLPLPFADEVPTESSGSMDFDASSYAPLIETADCDLLQFIESWTGASCKALGIGIASNAKLNDKKRLYRDALRELSDKIRNNRPFLGTPPAANVEGLNLFYSTIKFYLSKIAPVILADKSLRKERLQILEAALVCGGGLLGQLSELHLQLCEVKATSLKEQISERLSKIAHRKILQMVPYGDVHHANILKWQLYGFLGGKKVAKDHLAQEEDEIPLMIKFFRLFSPKNICLELCEDLKKDELFQRLLDDYIQDEFLIRFKDDPSVKKAYAVVETHYQALKRVFHLHKTRILEILNFLIEIPFEKLMGALNVMYRAGADAIVYKTLEMYLKHDTSVPNIRRLFSLKKELSEDYKFFTDLASLTGATKDRLIAMTDQELDESFKENQDVLLLRTADEEFSRAYKCRQNNLNHVGMCLVLNDLKFLEAFPTAEIF